MAISRDNLITLGLKGKFGNQLVFKTQKGQTIITKKPRLNDKKSEAQLKQRSRFGAATSYAKRAIADEDIRKLYDAKAQQSDKLQRAFNVAVADFMCAPEIQCIDVSAYSGQIGDHIIISATDDFMVKEVKVEVRRYDGSLVEEGSATLTSNGSDWVYCIQSYNELVEGSSVVIRVSDLPGNICEEEVVC